MGHEWDELIPGSIVCIYDPSKSGSSSTGCFGSRCGSSSPGSRSVRGMNLEDFLAGGGGGMAMAAMGGLLLSMALGDH